MKFSFIAATALLVLGVSSNRAEIKQTGRLNKIEGSSSVLVYANSKRDEDYYNYSQELLNRFRYKLPDFQ
jgi:hypothetical protein